MAHGGIRYLENGEFRLVREAVGERNRMLANAPHLVRPLPTTIPIFKWFSGLLNAPLKFFNLLSRPAERGALVIKVGLLFYDAFTGRRRRVPRHRMLGRAASLKQWRDLNPEVRFTATYYDGAILNPERLTLELVLDGQAEGPHARALNYVSLAGARGREVTLKDELGGETFEIRPRLLVNAAGPWIDFANRAMGLSTRLIGGTKGSHLVLDHPELRRAIGEHEFFFENQDGRIVLIFPLFDRVLVGTSDIPIEDPDQALCTDEEIDYFLAMLARVFPAIRVDRSQIVFRFSGVRPLPYSRAKSAGQISRDHSLHALSGVLTGLDFPVYSLVGGKWTSYRAFSEQVTDRALAFLGRPRAKNTRELPVGGGRGYPASNEEGRRLLEGLRAWTGLSLDRLETLFECYGTRLEELAMYIAKAPDRPLKSLPEYSRREIAFLAETERIVHLDDLLLRRTSLAKLGRLTRPAVDELARVLGEALGWTKRRQQDEVRRALAILAERHGVAL
jgi:glycerol-3-phosphate dehydrogenase